MLAKLDSTFFMLDKYMDTHNDELLKEAAKNIYDAGEQSFSSSAFVDDIDRKLSRAVNAVAFLIKRNENDDMVTAREVLNELVSFLMSPSLAGAKAFFDRTATLSEAPEQSPRFRFGSLRQNFLVQISISIIASLLIVPGITFIFGIAYNFDSANVVRTNPLLFIGAVIACFAGTLAALRVKQ